jgi:Protein of unknown function (DUF1559)
MRCLTLLALVAAAPAFAQPPARETPNYAPFIDEHTLVVARVDVSRVDVETVLKLAAAVVGEGDEVGEAADAVRASVKQFLQAGGRDVFVTYGPGDFPNLPCLIAPAPEGAHKAVGDQLVGLFKAADKEVQWTALHGCVCVGTKEALAVLKARKPVARADLAAALDAGADGVAQVAFALSAEARKIHEQVAPTLPPELGGGGIQKLTRGMKWMAVVVGPGPKMPARWVTECASPEAAGDLKEVERRAQQAVAAELLRAGDEPGPAARRLTGLFDNARTTQEGARLTTEWDLAPAVLAALKRPEGPPAERMRSANNLKQLMLALHNYHDAHGHFPTDVRDKDGKPLLSWRVAILPYVDQDALYKDFKLDEPWDSEHNKKLIDKMPKVLRSPRQAAALKDRTTYLAPLGKGLMWDEPKGLKITQIADGTSNTVALVEADDDRAVVWSKPEDITIDPRNPVTGLLGHYAEGFHAAMADGSVRFFKKGIEPMALWALFTRAGGEVVEGK